jgi:hypothetical protein
LYYLPTRPNKTQYIAAKIGNGIDANKAPNLPETNYETQVMIFKVKL